MTELAKLTDIDTIEGLFSEPTNPILEQFIDRFTSSLDVSLPGDSQKLMREFLLYGFVKATGHEMAGYSNPWVVEKGREPMRYDVNNGVITLHDKNSDKFIRRNGRYHGTGFLGPDEAKGEIEGTLVQHGYRWGANVPHSNGEVYASEQMEALFQGTSLFARQVQSLRGETGGLIIKDFSEPDPARYAARDKELAQVEIGDILMIPGNSEKIFRFDL